MNVGGTKKLKQILTNVEYMSNKLINTSKHMLSLYIVQCVYLYIITEMRCIFKAHTNCWLSFLSFNAFHPIAQNRIQLNIHQMISLLRCRLLRAFFLFVVLTAVIMILHLLFVASVIKYLQIYHKFRFFVLFCPYQ